MFNRGPTDMIQFRVMPVCNTQACLYNRAKSCRTPEDVLLVPPRARERAPRRGGGRTDCPISGPHS